jgi:hypothetical protein
MNLLRTTRFPEYAAFPMPQLEEIMVYRELPTLVSVLDYSRDFGHADLGRFGQPSECATPQTGSRCRRAGMLCAAYLPIADAPPITTLESV